MVEKVRAWSPPQILGTAFITVVLWSAIGFSWFGTGFGWVTQGAAQRLTASAVTDALAQICVAQAHSATDFDSAIKEFQALSSWRQSEFVIKSSWATMPGSDNALRSVSELCTTKLRAL